MLNSMCYIVVHPQVDGIILVYDITHEESFLNLQNWVTCIQVNA